MRDHVDPQPRRFALADAAIEQIDLIGHLRKQRIERLVQDLEPRHLGIAQVDHDAGAIGSLDPRLPQCVAQPDRRASRLHASRCLARLTSLVASSWRLTIAINLSATLFSAKAVCSQGLRRQLRQIPVSTAPPGNPDGAAGRQLPWTSS